MSNYKTFFFGYDEFETFVKDAAKAKGYKVDYVDSDVGVVCGEVIIDGDSRDIHDERILGAISEKLGYKVVDMIASDGDQYFPDDTCYAVFTKDE